MVSKLVAALLVPLVIAFAEPETEKREATADPVVHSHVSHHGVPHHPVPHHPVAHHPVHPVHPVAAHPVHPVHPAPHHAPHHDPYAPAPVHPPPAHHAYCDPKAPPACALNAEVPFCIEDPEYPAYEIADKISQDPIFLKKYSDIADQTADDLVQDLLAPQEASFDYNYYTGASKGPSPYDASHWIGPEGYLCPSQVDYVKIHRALNVEGFWRVILQHVPHDYSYGHYNYTQTTRLEACLTPDSACRLLAPCYGSKCTQKYIYHRMLSFDPCDPYRGFFIDTYKLPSACSCHIPDGHSPAPIAPAAHPVLTNSVFPVHPAPVKKA
jgi:hypothetical protein